MSDILPPHMPPDSPELVPPPPVVKRLTHKERAVLVKKIGAYFGLSFNIASQKYSELKASNELDGILAKYDQGEKLDRPICPNCAGLMIRRRASWGGEFWGCNSFPSCRGIRQIMSEIKDVTDEQRAETTRNISIALDYIKAIGGIDEARRWINIAAISLENKPNAVS